MPIVNNASRNAPSDSALRAALRFVFDELDWHIWIACADPFRLAVHGRENPLFEDYRSGHDFELMPERARAAIVAAVVAMVHRENAAAFASRIGGPQNLATRAEEATAQLRRRMRKFIKAAIDEGGYETLVSLTEGRWLPTTFGPKRYRTDPDPRQPTLGELFEELTAPSVENAVSAVDFCAEMAGLDAGPVRRLSEVAAGDEYLRRAVKFVLSSPVSSDIVRRPGSEFALEIRGCRRFAEFARCQKVGDEADRARTAIALTATFLVSLTSKSMFERIAPRSLGPAPARLTAYRAHIRTSIELAVAKNGHLGLLELCARRASERALEPASDA
ncbi:MAG: hypothetical protein Q7J28_17715 [Caulobacter sp.]|nr:hypothetical protein [Caulobacter sp.]